nr:MAG TPA: hypothetical protein [Caudoviricetes sp.]
MFLGSPAPQRKNFSDRTYPNFLCSSDTPERLVLDFSE